MKKKYLVFFVLIIACFSFQKLRAQDAGDNAIPPKSYWQAGLSYLSNNVYLGRKDSVTVPYITPSIGYYHKSGLFINGSLSYLPGSGQNRIDALGVEGGYSFSSGNFDGEISASKQFHSSKSYSVKSEIKGSLNTSLSYDFGFIKPSVQAGIDFSKKSDYGAGLGLEHSFFAASKSLEIIPTFLLNASTQNYYNAYYSKRKYSPKRKLKTGNGLTTISAYLSNASKFKIMDYEFAVPVNYTLNNFTFNFSPTLALPTNPTVVILTTTTVGGVSNSKTFTEKLSNVFYWSAGVTYSF